MNGRNIEENGRKENESIFFFRCTHEHFSVPHFSVKSSDLSRWRAATGKLAGTALQPFGEWF
jgi:hypothetical protein